VGKLPLSHTPPLRSSEKTSDVIIRAYTKRKVVDRLTTIIVVYKHVTPYINVDNHVADIIPIYCTKLHYVGNTVSSCLKIRVRTLKLQKNPFEYGM